MLFWMNILLSLIGAGAIALSAGRWWLMPLAAVGLWLALLLLSAAFLLLVCAFVDQRRPQEKESPFFRCLAKQYIDFFVRVARLRIHTQGMEKMPRGPVFLVCNHLNDIDPGVLMHLFPEHKLSFLSKRENREKIVIGPVMHKLRCPLVHRENDREALKAILQAVRILQEGNNSVGAFPEGYTSLDGKLHSFRSGVFKIAQKARVPIVVCTLRRTQTVLPALCKGKSSEVTFHLVGVLEPAQIQGRTAVEVAKQVYGMMIEDLGEDFLPETPQNT